MEKDKPGPSLNEIIKELPPELKAEVRDFAEFLLVKRRPRGTRPLSQD